ncbi:DUF5672 family protein [Telluribacter humicola]|uniref:DUF5672 family protein n=1 Tax=Telluribacter humicola TaxID=1720261 RepID=UPI001A969C39|nr:DUF5672 family protein [Telluribacter humicola]
MKELVTVVVPVYNSRLTPFEEKMLEQCTATLVGFPILFISEDNLDLSGLKEKYPDCTQYTFDSKYFESRSALSRLLLTEDFYERFDWSEFILLFECNSYVYRNELRYWCHQGYDLIQAAPTDLDRSPSLWHSITSISRAKVLSAGSVTELEGSGISLRRVEKLRKALNKYKREAYQYRNKSESLKNDSLFWETEMNKGWPSLQIPTPIVRDRFALYANSKTFEAVKPFALTGLTEKDTYQGID